MISRRSLQVGSIPATLSVVFIGKEQLEALKKMKKVAEPILTVEEKASKVNKAEIKGTGFHMEMVSSEKGRVMIEAQRDSRRQRHIAAVNESHKFVDQFYDNFCERKNEIKERSRIFISNKHYGLSGHVDNSVVIEADCNPIRRHVRSPYANPNASSSFLT